jgi:ADP-heptose:LPS heptosyltransferase
MKFIIKLIIQFCINACIFPSKNITPKTILLIRLDAIGDYVLFRNFIQTLKTSNTYKDYNITLVGNNAWKILSENLDNQDIDRFIWIDRHQFNKNFFYRYKKLKEISSAGYEIILSPIYSREFFYADTIVKLVSAYKKIGSVGELQNLQSWQTKLGNRYYTELLQADDNLIFEFFRNKEFFHSILKEDIVIKKPFIDISAINSSITLPEHYIVLFLGASATFKKWSTQNFIKVAEFIRQEYKMDIIICGDHTEIEAAEKFNHLFADGVLNMVGKTSLLDVLTIINNAELLIANETSAPHFAVALAKPSIIVIYNGNHFGRFTPYPKELSNKYHVVYHPAIENNLTEYKIISNQYGYYSQLDINDIEVDSVIKKMTSILY